MADRPSVGLHPNTARLRKLNTVLYFASDRRLRLIAGKYAKRPNYLNIELWGRTLNLATFGLHPAEAQLAATLRHTQDSR